MNIIVAFMQYVFIVQQKNFIWRPQDEGRIFKISCIMWKQRFFLFSQVLENSHGNWHEEGRKDGDRVIYWYINRKVSCSLKRTALRWTWGVSKKNKFQRINFLIKKEFLVNTSSYIITFKTAPSALKSRRRLLSR